MRSINGFVYFFQSSTEHMDGYFIQCYFITGEVKNSMRVAN